MDMNLSNKKLHSTWKIFFQIIFLGKIQRSSSSNKTLIPTKSPTTVIGKMICGFLI